MIVYRYFADVPFIDTHISIFWGCMVCSWLWIAFNALLALIFDVHGHVTIIAIGLPIVAGVVYNLRSKRLQRILFQSTENTKTSIDALIQIVIVREIIKKSKLRSLDNVSLIGLINLHV